MKTKLKGLDINDVTEEDLKMWFLENLLINLHETHRSMYEALVKFKTCRVPTSSTEYQKLKSEYTEVAERCNEMFRELLMRGLELKEERNAKKKEKEKKEADT